MTRLSKNGPRMVGRQVEVGRRDIEKKGTVDSHTILEQIVPDYHPQSNELGKGEMAKALAGVITSRSETFVEVEEMHKRVPSKHLNDARKQHRLRTNDLRHIFEAIREHPGIDLERVCKEMQYDVEHERIQKLVDSVTFPVIRKGPLGAPIALTYKDDTSQPPVAE